MKRNQALKYSISGMLALGVLIGGYLYFGRSDQDPFEKYLTVTASRGTVRRTVSSTGTMQAVITVQVGSQVSGRIQELHADFNSVVKKGQLLAVIDPANFEAQRERAQASLATALAAVKNAEANLINRGAELKSAKANLEVVEVGSKEAERQFNRAQGLFKEGLIPEQDMETAQANFDQSIARVHQSEAQVNQVEASVRSALAQQDQAAANVKQARAELQMAEVNLRYTSIISPIDGVVIERNVDIGQTVAASFQAPILFLIANDLAKMQVIAQIDEADIGALSEKAHVEFTVDAFPGQTFPGKISEIRLSSKLPASSTSSGSSTTGSTGGGSASNVVVYNVIIDVNNPQLKLRPGMTANVNFTVASTENVVKVANSALRYRPPDKNPEDIQKLLASLPGTVSADTSQTGALSPAAKPEPSPSADSPRSQAEPGTSGRTDRSSRQGSGRSRFSELAGKQGGAQAVIGPSMTDIYGINAGMKIRFPQAEEQKPTMGILWILDSKAQPQPRRVKLGITDGRETAVLDGELKEGDTVVTGEIDGEEGAQGTTSPFSGPFGRPPTRPSGRSGGR